MSTVTHEKPAPPRGAAPRSAPVVSVAHLCKSFRNPHEQYQTLKERALHPLRKRGYDELRAVDDVSFEIAAGEFFGITGRNGSGKSTLLKCLAGIYDTDDGEIEVDGRLSPFIELGVGFNMDLTARDNVMINAIMLGLTRKQARARFDDIIAFAELEDFLDLKLKNYSSGMSVRLAFSVAIQVDAEILLIDEVLAVGDASFQQKCFDEFARIKASGRTVVLVTHDMSAIERFCDRAMVLEGGRIVALGDPLDIARTYNELNFGRQGGVSESEGGQRFGDGAAELLDTWVEDAHGEPASGIAQGEHCRVCVRARANAELVDPLFNVSLRNETGQPVFAASSQWKESTGRFSAGDTAVVRIAFDNWLAPGRYSITPSVARNGAGADVHDMREDMAAFVVHGPHVSGGLADIPHSFEVERE